MTDRTKVIKAIRAIKPAETERQDCYICGSFKAITHCHHVVPVSEVANWCIKHDFDAWIFPSVFIWLCPNHHTILHRIRKNNLDCDMYSILNKSELIKLQEIDDIESEISSEAIKLAVMRREFNLLYVWNYVGDKYSA